MPKKPQSFWQGANPKLPLPSPASPVAQTGSPIAQMAVGVIRLAYRSNHSLAGRALPFFAHALAGVATPALDEGVAGKKIAVNAAEIVFMQPTLGPTIDLIAVIKQPTRPI